MKLSSIPEYMTSRTVKWAVYAIMWFLARKAKITMPEVENMLGDLASVFADILQVGAMFMAIVFRVKARVKFDEREPEKTASLPEVVVKKEQTPFVLATPNAKNLSKDSKGVAIIAHAKRTFQGVVVPSSLVRNVVNLDVEWEKFKANCKK